MFAFLFLKFFFEVQLQNGISVITDATCFFCKPNLWFISRLVFLHFDDFLQPSSVFFTYFRRGIRWASRFIKQKRFYEHGWGRILKGYSDLRLLWHIDRICHNCLTGAGPTSETRAKHGPPYYPAQNGEVSAHVRLSSLISA